MEQSVKLLHQSILVNFFQFGLNGVDGFGLKLT